MWNLSDSLRIKADITREAEIMHLQLTCDNYNIELTSLYLLFCEPSQWLLVNEMWNFSFLIIDNYYLILFQIPPYAT